MLQQLEAKEKRSANAPFNRTWSTGVKAAGSAAFVLVAGGLGERLGYSGIKLALPVESASGKCFLQVRGAVRSDQRELSHCEWQTPLDATYSETFSE